MPRITGAVVVRRNGEYIVRAYTVKNPALGSERYPEADYFTDDKDDAYATADAMVRQSAGHGFTQDGTRLFQ